MRDGEKEYGMCKDVCNEMGCYCPEEYEFHLTVANCKAWIRGYFFHAGFEACKEEFQKENKGVMKNGK